jgi:hypothetical protein
MYELGGKVQLEELDSDKTIVFGMIRAENRSECPCANLVKNAKWAECFRVSGARGFRVQWVLLGSSNRTVSQASMRQEIAR